MLIDLTTQIIGYQRPRHYRAQAYRPMRGLLIGPRCPKSILQTAPRIGSRIRFVTVVTDRQTDATPICYMRGVATAQPSTNDGPTYNTS